MREIRSSGSVGERGGNKPLYPEVKGIRVKCVHCLQIITLNEM